MLSRRILFGLAVCFFLTALTVYHNARYIFYSVVPVAGQTNSIFINRSLVINSWQGNESHAVSHGHVPQPANEESPRQLTYVIAPRNRNFSSKSDTKRASANATDGVSSNVTIVPVSVAKETESHVPRSTWPKVKDNQTPIHVLLLSYQRSGSTFISSLFGDNSHIFFLYEPLDGLYTALYGLMPGWTVPADLAINRDGTLRKMPSLESESATTFLNNIYQCEFDSLPTEFLIHPFWWYFVNWTEMAKPYTSCLRAYGLTDRSLSVIQRSISIFCGKRFGDPRNKQGKCFGKLWPDYPGKELETLEVARGLKHNARTKPHQLYTNSLKQIRKKVSFCVNKYLSKPCKQTRFRAIKTVRGTMEEAEVLLEKDEHFKVIHLLRDPRGVTRSRIQATWSRGFYDMHKEGHVAHVYCSTALNDYRIYERLRTKYPGRVMHIMLEDFVDDPEAKLAELSDFLGVQFDADTLHKLYKRMKPGFVDKWREKLSDSVVKAINEQCKDFMAALNIPK